MDKDKIINSVTEKALSGLTSNYAKLFEDLKNHSQIKALINKRVEEKIDALVDGLVTQEVEKFKAEGAAKYIDEIKEGITARLETVIEENKDFILKNESKTENTENHIEETKETQPEREDNDNDFEGVDFEDSEESEEEE